MISKGGKPQACPLVFNFQKALIIPNILIIQITQIFLITPNSPPKEKKTKKNMQNIRLFKIKALPLHRI